MNPRALRTVTLLILALVLGPHHSASAQTPLEQSASQFTNKFWADWSDSNQTALAEVQFDVDDPVEFLGKSLSRADYLKTLAAFAKRWPERQYSLDPSSQTVSCDQTTLTCIVSGVASWRDFSPSRNVTSIGTLKYALTLREHKDAFGHLTGLLIEAIDNSDTGQKLLQAPPDSAVFPALAGGNFLAAPQHTDDASHNSIVSDAALQNVGCPSNDDESLDHQDCISLAEKDVTSAFHLRQKTVLEILQATDNVASDGLPPMGFCFFQKEKAECHYDKAFDQGFAPNHVFDLSLVYPRPGAEYPLLLAHLSWCCGFGCGGLFNYVWAYNPDAGVFKLIWAAPYDCHSTIRFMTKGPLAGDMIAVANDVTDHWPWPFGIYVFRLTPPDKLEKILYFVGRAGQGGKYVTGPNDAIDVDMPETLRRLGLSQ